MNDRPAYVLHSINADRLILRSLIVAFLSISFGFIDYAALAETPGEHFEKAMKRLAENCAKAKLRPGETGCDPLKLKPADPLATPEGRFAHSIKIPNPVPENSGYKTGMTPQEYFDHLCKTEAGEFIYKTIENVEGLYMMRPRKRATDYELEHLYALEDPYGHTTDESFLVQETYVQPATGRYQFLEMPLSQALDSAAKYRRYYRDVNAHPGRQYQTAINGQGVFVPYIVAEAIVPDIKSRYGYTWRGIRRPHDRELGIAGGELIILDLKTKEIMAIRRGYMRTGFVRNNLTGVWWLTGPSCPNRGTNLPFKFIQKVLMPLPSAMQEKKNAN
ncbi:MAG TPA: hypothetical protein VJ692_16365 [Nitrospiraceae bacterium]|nr:hypothetical protein [Nitrospiraceae bacterium]